MANAAEKGGGGSVMTSSSDVVARNAGSVPNNPRPAAPRKVTRKKKTTGNVGYRTHYNDPAPRHHSSSGGQRRASNSVSRRVNSRSSSSSNNQRKAPVSPPKPTEKIIKPVSPPKPVPPRASDYLRSDSTYQRQLAAYAKSLSDFQADQGLATTDYNTGYQGTYRDIGLAKQQASTNLQDDYASRGLLKSSLYNTALGDLNQQYQNQYGDLAKQRTSFLDQLGQELGKYKNEQGVQQQNAMQEAMRRRAEKFNL